MKASLKTRFREWARDRVAKQHGATAADLVNLECLNLNSVQQLKQLLFGRVDDEPVEFRGLPMPASPEDLFAGDNDVGDSAGGPIIYDLKQLENMTFPDLRVIRDKLGVPKSRTKAQQVSFIAEWQRGHLQAKKGRDLRTLCAERGLLISGKK